MPPMGESRELARAMREHVRKSINKNGTRIVKAIVRQTNPLAVEVTTADMIVSEDSLLLGAWPRAYDKRHGIKADDTVVMTMLDDGNWYVMDVLSQEDFHLGDHPELMTTAAYNTGSGHVVAEIPYHDESGAVVGVLLVYDNATLRNFLGHDNVNSNPVVPN